MARNVLAMVVMAVTGAAASISGGFLLASFATTGVAPGSDPDRQIARIVSAEPTTIVAGNWPPADPLAGIRVEPRAD